MVSNEFKRKMFSFLKSEGITAFNNKFSARTLASKKFEVNTLIDVGVKDGTFELYPAYPDAEIVLIDPIPGAAQKVADRLSSRTTFVYEVGAGDQRKELSFDIHQSRGHSSFLSRSEAFPSEISETITAKIVTLDELIIANDHLAPFGLKIDVEGYELACLKGASQTVGKSSFVLIEASVKKRFADSYRFSELIGTMASYGFQLLDILNASGGEPAFFDCLFVPENHPRIS